MSKPGPVAAARFTSLYKPVTRCFQTSHFNGAAEHQPDGSTKLHLSKNPIVLVAERCGTSPAKLMQLTMAMIMTNSQGLLRPIAQTVVAPLDKDSQSRWRANMRRVQLLYVKGQYKQCQVYCDFLVRTSETSAVPVSWRFF